MREFPGEQLDSRDAQPARAEAAGDTDSGAPDEAGESSAVAEASAVAKAMADKMADRKEENEWRPLWGPRRERVRQRRGPALPEISLQVWTWGLLRRMPRSLTELQEQLGVTYDGARRTIRLLQRSGVAIETADDGQFHLFYEVPLEVVARSGKWCMARPSQLGVSVDEVLASDDQGRTVARALPRGDSGFLIPPTGDPDLYKYADLYKQIYTQITATILGARTPLSSRRARQPEDLPLEHQSQWRPVWGPLGGDVSGEAPKSLNIWVWGLLRTMPRSMADLQHELGIREGHITQITYQLRKRGIPIQMRADGRYYMLDHSPIKIVRTRDGFRMARPGEKTGRSIAQLPI